MKKLSPEEKAIILDKGTEHPFSGKYYNFNKQGTYICKQCGRALYHSSAKFDSGCGWPSFDEAILAAVKQQPDKDGQRIEILCTECNAHLGHIFFGEALTPKNVRHCVNSIALEFIPNGQQHKQVAGSESAIFAGGCFWGVEYFMKDLPGIISVTSGYMGGTIANPSYQDICQRHTGHAEVVQIIFDPEKITYETLVKHFFEIHDPEQKNAQGPDIAEQYRSEIFYTTPKQKETAEKLIHILKDKGYKLSTLLTPATTFWRAEDYHQNYYVKNGKQPYCHHYVKRF